MSMYRNELFIGLVVDVIQKNHQKSGELTRGKIVKILTSKGYHSRGIKVSIETLNGELIVGRIKEVIGY